MRKSYGPDLRVFLSGLIVHPEMPFLGTSPDAKVLDPHCVYPFGLLEIKCSFKNNEKTLEEKCKEKDFYLKEEDGKFKLNRNCAQGKLYYSQVQGQLAITGLPWCDFVVLLSGSGQMAVNRIYFDHDFWIKEMFPKLAEFYHVYAVPHLIVHARQQHS